MKLINNLVIPTEVEESRAYRQAGLANARYPAVAGFLK